MSLHIAVGKQGPPVGIGVFPALVPCRFGELASRSVDGLNGRPVTDTIVIRGDANDGAILTMETHVILLKMAPSHAIEVPEFGESGHPGAGDGGQRAQREGCIKKMEEMVEDVEKRDEDEEIHSVREELEGLGRMK